MSFRLFVADVMELTVEEKTTIPRTSTLQTTQLKRNFKKTIVLSNAHVTAIVGNASSFQQVC